MYDLLDHTETVQAAATKVVEPDLTEALAAAERVANRGFGPESMLGSPEAAERARRDYEAAQQALALQMLNCRYCKGAVTRALNKLDERAKQPTYDMSRLTEDTERAHASRCKEHAMRGRLNFACSPVSENYWCS